MSAATNPAAALRLSLAILGAGLASATPARLASAERPSFLQVGDAFCTNEDDFDGFTARHAARPNSAGETCRTMTQPTRVAILGGHGGLKTMVRIMAGTYAYQIGWTNGALPVQ